MNTLLLTYVSSAVVRTALAGAILALLMVACASPQSEISRPEKRAQGLNKSIMCPICPGESIDQSQATIAIQMRAIVRDKLDDGWTDDQIRNFFVDRYGPSVLMEPPTDGFSILAWIVPPVVVVVAVTAFLFAISWMRGTARREPQHELMVEADLDRYIERIEASLEPGLTRVSPIAKDSEVDEPDRGERSDG